MHRELTGMPSSGELEALVKFVFGSGARFTSVNTVNQKTDYIVLLVELVEPSLRVVIKLAGDAASEAYNFERSAVIYDIVSHQTDISMPQIYALDLSCGRWPWRYIVKTFIPGMELAQILPGLDEDEKKDVFLQFGNAVAQLHRIHFPMFGEINPDGGVTGSRELISALEKRADQFIKDEGLRDFFIQVLYSKKSCFENIQQADLTHEDLHKHNIIFEKHQGHWRLATILDFDKAWAGHGESDLSRLDLWRGMQHEAFRVSYQNLLPLAPEYQVRRPVYQLLWCLEFGDQGKQHYLDSLQVCDELNVTLPYWFTDK